MPKAAQFLPDVRSLKNDKGIDLYIHQCSGCGLVQLNNTPVKYYKQVIRATGISQEMRSFRIRQFNDFVKKYSLAGKKIIEIGCGKGEYVSLMQQCSEKSYGIEDSKESVKQCKKNGLKVFSGFIQNNTYKLNHAPFDAFFILNFLEHLPDPNAVLSGISHNLSNNAVGIIEVPNFDMILRKKLFSEFIIDHLFYFTKETLRSLLILNGFEIIECHEIFHNYILSVVVKKRNKLNILNFNKHQTKIKKNIEIYLSQYNSKKVAIWGAGHQALTIISLIDLTDKIRYVVDSAVFKQNKYTPATHIPIVSPVHLDSDPVDAIIVMAGGYSNEVVKIVQKKYATINVAVLYDYGLEIIHN
ncbi:MAG: class I SAM-dependent methyltransferase [bacterium]|nr:class I SAM-dependent methyltransferase [bacterium]